MGLRSLLGVPLFVVTICVSLQLGNDYLLQRQFHVHNTGILLITGASHGIGRHTLISLAKLGYHVFGAVRNQKSVLELTKEAKELNLESFVHPIVIDMRNFSQFDHAYQTIVKYMNESQLPFVGLINNAGISFLSPLETTTEENMREVMDINFIGAIILTQKFLTLSRQELSRVLFVSGFNGIFSRYGQGIYSASKHAMEATTDSLRLEMIPFGVSVSSIIPGCITSSSNPTTDNIDLPMEYVPLYGENMRNVVKMINNRIPSCSSPSVTSDAILHALRDPYPHTRYYVGNTGIIPMWLWKILRIILVDRMYDVVREWELAYT